MSIVQERAAIRREIKERRKEVYPQLQKALKLAKARKKKRLKACETESKARTKKARAQAAKARRLLDAHIKRARAAAQKAFTVCKTTETTQGLDNIERALKAIQKESDEISKLRTKAASMISEKGRAGGKRAAELKAESDDAVIFNLEDDAAMIALFKKVRGKIKKTKNLSRTEAFLEYVSDNPSELDELRAKQELKWEREAEKMWEERKAPDVLEDLESCKVELMRLKKAQRLVKEVPF